MTKLEVTTATVAALLFDSEGTAELFPFEYVGGGYFRLRGVPALQKAPILHGHEVIRHIEGALGALLLNLYIGMQLTDLEHG